MIYVQRLTLYKETRNCVLENAEVILEVIEQLGNPNNNVKKQAEQVVDIIQHYSPQWANTIKLKKYSVHNQVYIQAMEEYERMAANEEYAQEVMDEGGNPNEILWYDSNEINGRIWAPEEDQEYQQ